MSPLSCPEVRDHIDLYACGECDPPTRDSVASHLAACADCSRLLDEARRLAALLDLHHRRPDSLRRLQARLDSEARARPRPARVLTLRRVASLAAMLLLTFGLALLVGPGLRPAPDGGPPTPEGDLAVTLTALPARTVPAFPGPRDLAKAGPGVAFEEAKKAADRTAVLDLHGRSPAAFRAALEGVRGAPPPPPEVDLSLRVRNDTHSPVRLHPEAPTFEVRLHVEGPGVVTVPAPPAGRLATPVRPVTLPPGETFSLSIPRLVSRAGDGVRYTYWTEPGVYTVTARVRMLVARAEAPPRFGPAQPRAFTTDPVTFEVVPRRR
jgi:hypothetical protein